MSTRVSLIAQLARYQSAYAEELTFKDSFLDLLAHDRAFHRDHLPGHITASAWIVDDSGESVLLTLHAKLNRWLQPGGHADGEEDVLAVARREAFEETGLLSLHVLSDSIFDIDIHNIPQRKDFPAHLHFDIRFLLRGDIHETPVLTAESHQLAWQPVGGLAALTGNNASMLRMAEKVKRLF